MNLKNYFNEQTGLGVLATADAAGRVDAAIYARPHVLEDGSLAMIMRDRLTYRNLQENPWATYLFVEQSVGYRGLRLYLKKTREDQDPDLIARMTRRSLSTEEDRAKGQKFMVYFEVEKALQLIGSEEV